MDRKLVTGAVLLLALQIFLLVADVNIYPGDQHALKQNAAHEIGLIYSKKQNVKRKSMGSVVWEDSQNSDSLLEYDSILTLENSSAQIKLKDDIQIDLQENTLVVLEPPTNEQTDSLRIRFSRGDFSSQNPKQRLKIGRGDWSIDAKPGTGMSLKTLTGDQVEVEVSHGSIELQNKDNPATRESVQQGTRFTLSKNEILAPQKISEELQFKNPTKENVYSHEFPVEHRIEWAGEAQILRLIGPDKTPKYIEIPEGENFFSLNLNEGTYYLSLQNENKISKEMVLKILKAPLIRYTSPLPRDRYIKGDTILFGWLAAEGVRDYTLELSNALGEMEKYATQDHALTQSPKLGGQVYMRVYGEDEFGFKIPSYYSQILYLVDDPLAPPKLIKPETRRPANDTKAPAEKKKNSNGAFLIHKPTWFKTFFEVFISPALAQETESPQKAQVVFSWYPVEGADFYNLEISSRADFQYPEVITKISKTTYTWSNFAEGKYYWRVAGGSNSGRMGLFSEAAAIDLTHVNDLTENQEISPGVIVISPTDSRTKESRLKNYEQKTQKPYTPNTPAISLFVGPPQPEEPKKNLYAPWAQLNLTHNFYSYDKQFSASLTGFSKASITAGLDFTSKDNNKFQSVLRYDWVDWLAKDPQALPFQKKYTIHEYSFTGLYLFTSNEFKIGATLENVTLLDRIGLEELNVKSELLYGPALGYSAQVADNMKFNTVAALLLGQSGAAINSNSDFNYFMEKKFSKYYLGADFNFKLFFGRESASGFYLKTGLHIGRSW